MDGLNPCLALISDVRRSLEGGESVRLAVRRFARGRDPFCEQSGRWLMLIEKGGDASLVLKELSSPHRRMLLGLLERGLRGEPIALALREFETEIIQACRNDMERHLTLMPFRLLVPLMLLIFPSLMLLLFGPFLDALSGGFR